MSYNGFYDYNNFVFLTTNFKGNARAVKSQRIQPAFRKYLKENGPFNKKGEDILKPIGKFWNPTTQRIVSRKTVFKKNGEFRSRFAHLNTVLYKLVEQGKNEKFNTTDYICKRVATPYYDSTMSYEQYVKAMDKLSIESKLKALAKACVPKMGFTSRIVIETRYFVEGMAGEDLEEIKTWSHGFTNEKGEGFKKYNVTSWDQYWLKVLGEQYEDLIINKDSKITLQTNYIPKGGACAKLPKWLQGKNGVFHIVNDDDLCGQRCLAVATHGGYKDLRKPGRGEKQIDKLTKKMCDSIEHHDRMSYLDFDKFAKVYKKYVVILHDISGEPIHTSEDGRDSEKQEDIVYIFHDTTINHYHLITKMDAFVSEPTRRAKYCAHCEKSFEVRAFKKHKCKGNRCRCCQSFEPHSQKKDWAQCELCNAWCLNGECLEQHKKNFHTYKKANAKKGVQAGDIKAPDNWKCGKCKTWVDHWRFHTGQHVCGETKCRNCGEYHTDAEHRCNIVRPEAPKNGDNETYIAFDFESKFEDGYHRVNLACSQQLYTGQKFTHHNIKDFIEFAMEQKKTTFIAHNLKGYDGWLIHHELIKSFGRKPDKITLAGAKIMYMKFGSVRFIDSLNFITTGLSEMPKMFGLDTTQFKKGYFPYLMNTDEYKNYVGQMPPASLFEPHKFKPSSGNLKKYGCIHKATQATQNDFHEWHASQVKAGVVYDFQKELLEYCESDVDILAKSLQVFRDDMKEQNQGCDPLQSITIAGYCMHVYLQQHAPTEAELDKTEETKPLQTAISVLKREEYQQMKAGFHGGRTEVFRLFQEWGEEEIKAGKHGRYIDIASLYPTVQFFDNLPYGKPTVHDFKEEGKQDVDVTKYFGYVVCDITPPSNLRVPLLGGKSETGKFCFGLERMPKATVPTPELHKALTLGYKIDRVYKVFHFKKSKELFKSYIRTFSRAKIESSFSGSDEERAELVATYKNKFGIELREEKMTPNAGRKANAKLMLNSLWGKFGQRQMKTSTYVNDPSNWYKLLRRSDKGEVTIHNREHVGDCLFVEYTENKEENTNLNKTNVALCGVLTSNARLRLYEVIGDQRLNDRLIYCDTDSCIYEYDKTKWNPKEGGLLGDWEPEFEEPMKRVVCTGPKAYAYQKHSGKYDVKSKGVQLTHENLHNIDFTGYKSLVDGGKALESSAMLFKKTKQGMLTEHKPKQLTLDKSEFKRHIIPGTYDTLPFGYKQQ